METRYAAIHLVASCAVPLEVSAAVRNKALAVGAGEWLDGLSELVAGIERDWGISVGRAYMDGTEAFVADATASDGTLAVLKLGMPRAAGDAHTENEATVLRLCAGDGCPALLREDLDRGALLLERLGPSLSQLGLPTEVRQRIICDTASRVWRPAVGADLPSGADKAAWLIDFITTTWEELDRPCSERAVDHAVACAERRARAHDGERAVLVHGDVHQWNTLASLTEAGTYKLVDPDGLLAEPEYDLGTSV